MTHHIFILLTLRRAIVGRSAAPRFNEAFYSRCYTVFRQHMKFYMTCKVLQVRERLWTNYFSLTLQKCKKYFTEALFVCVCACVLFLVVHAGERAPPGPPEHNLGLCVFRLITREMLEVNYVR